MVLILILLLIICLILLPKSSKYSLEAREKYYNNDYEEDDIEEDDIEDSFNTLSLIHI